MRISIKPQNQNTSISNTPEHLVEEVAPSLQSRYSYLWTLLLRVILPFLAIRLLLEIVGLVTIYYLLPLINRKQPIYPGTSLSHFPDKLWLMWNHFDSGFYLSIAHDGYWGANTLHAQSNWGFFPLYPLLIHLLALPFGTSVTAYNLVGLVISNVAALVAAIYLYKLTTRELNAAAAARAVFYLALFPMSFYLSAIYPESLFLALSISSIYYARLHRWGLAGLLGGLAALTRPSGVLLAIAIGWEYWQFLADQSAPLEQTSGFMVSIQQWLHSRFIGLWRSLSRWRTWFGFVELALIPGGLLLFLLYSKWKAGTFLAYFMTQKYGWNHDVSNPILLVLRMLQHPERATPYDWNFYMLNMLSILLFACLLVPIFRKLPAIYGIVSLAFLLMPLTTGKIDSAARYYLTIFPVFMLLAWCSSQGKQEQQIWRHSIIIASFAILLSVGMVLFTLGVYSIA